MNIERKYIDLKDLTVTDEGPGHISGYRAVFSEIDEGGDLIVPGFFKDSIVEYLEAGFTAHSHDWDFDKAVGYPVSAKEDEHGFFVDSEFHSTADAQSVRTKAVERKKAGKRVGFSFGYSISDKSFIEAKDYKEQLPQYIKAERLQANLLKAQKFDRVRILKKGEIIEDSIVTAPMNKLAMATAVKSDAPQDTGGLPFGTVEVNGKIIPTGGYGCHTCPAQFQKIEDAATHGKTCRALNYEANQESDVKGMLAEEMAQTTPSTWEVESALRRVIRKIAETAKDSDVTGVVMDWKAKVTEAINEYPPTMTPIVIAQIEEFLESSDDEFYLKGITGTESFESFEAAGTELTKFAQKMRSNHELRLKEGRVLSSSNRAKVQACKDSMTALIADLDDLLAISEPKPKESEKESEFDLVALKAQSARLRNHALRTLARIAKRSS